MHKQGDKNGELEHNTIVDCEFETGLSNIPEETTKFVKLNTIEINSVARRPFFLCLLKVIRSLNMSSTSHTPVSPRNSCRNALIITVVNGLLLRNVHQTALDMVYI